MSGDHNFRMAALKLHGLHSKDRDWLLERFDSAQQGKLRALIAELDELGFVSTDQIPARDLFYPVGSYQLDSHTAARLNQADTELVMKVLNDLPSLLKAMVLHARHWQWSSHIWARFDQFERQRMVAHINQFASIKPSVFSALIDSFAEAVGKATSSHPSKQPAPRVGKSRFWRV